MKTIITREYNEYVKPNIQTESRKQICMHMVIDKSGSMGTIELQEVWKCFKKLTKKILSLNDYLQVSLFASSLSTVMGMKMKSDIDFKRLKSSIVSNDLSSKIGSGTSLYDAIGESLRIHPRNKIYKNHLNLLILLTDGLENGSTLFTKDSLLSSLSSHGINDFHFFLISVGDSSDSSSLCTSKNCLFVQSKNFKDLMKSFRFVKRRVYSLVRTVTTTTTTVAPKSINIIFTSLPYKLSNYSKYTPILEHY